MPLARTRDALDIDNKVPRFLRPWHSWCTAAIGCLALWPMAYGIESKHILRQKVPCSLIKQSHVIRLLTPIQRTRSPPPWKSVWKHSRYLSLPLKTIVGFLFGSALNHFFPLSSEGFFKRLLCNSSTWASHARKTSLLGLWEFRNPELVIEIELLVFYLFEAL